MTSKRSLVLIVAAVDSGGGAGITADVLTVHDHGAWGLPLVNAVTSQSLKQVAGIENVSSAMFSNMLNVALSDWEKISAVKVGLMPDKKSLEIFLDALETKLKDAKVVWDPVLTATAGRLDSADLKSCLARILKVTTIFTPNLPEALELAGWDKDKLKKEGVFELGRVFVRMGAQNVIIKGGHLGDEVATADDVFVSERLSFMMRLPKTAGDGAHGGGCALSSALAALLAKDYAPEDAAVLAKAYVYHGILEPDLQSDSFRPPVGHHGLTKNLKYFPEIFEEGFPQKSSPFPTCPMLLGLYPVVDSVEWVETLLAMGVRTIQLRIKDKDDPKLVEKIRRSVFLSRLYKARLFIDDHYDLAIAEGAYGVHLGMEDLRTADLEKIRKAGLRLGVSTHGLYEMLKGLQLNPSYIALGHIFPTKSKVMPSKPQGVEKLAHEASLLQNVVPTVAIGGIKLHNLADVLASGVGSVALITGITQSDDPLLTTQKWLSLCKNGGDEV